MVRGIGKMSAAGKTAHAAMPESGESAILRLIAGLLEEPCASALCAQEREFLSLVARLTATFDGRGAGLACADEDFGPLTMVGGLIGLRADEGGTKGAKRIFQSIDIRYPTAITAQRIAEVLSAAAAQIGARLEVNRTETPYLTSVDSPEVQSLFAAYRTVTGDTAHGPITMGGGTYARKFSRAVSFGVERPWVADPAWVGTMHGADEGVSEAALKMAFKVYATAIHTIPLA